MTNKPKRPTEWYEDIIGKMVTVGVERHKSVLQATLERERVV